MENKVDDLFRDKLEHHSVSPNAEAWQKVEANLVKKNNPTWWWRIAAVVLLVGCLLSVMLQFNNDTTQDSSIDLAHESKNTNESKLKPVQGKPIKEKPTTAKDIRKSQAPATLVTKTISSATSTKEGTSLAQINTVEYSIKQEAGIEEEVSIAVAVNRSPIADAPERPIVLEFTITPIDPVAVALPKEKTNGIKKLFTKAKEIKNGEGGFDLYEITSKLFASANKQDKNNIN